MNVPTLFKQSSRTFCPGPFRRRASRIRGAAFWSVPCHGKPHIQHVENLEQRVEARIAVAGKRAIERLPAQPGRFGYRSHPLRPRDVAERLGEVFRIVFFQRDVQIFDQRLVAVEKVDRVEFPEFHHASLELTGDPVRTAHIALLTRLVAAA